ncbi:hypothetical protein ACTBUY_001944 [Salmonella enterica subsp. enterica]
MSDKPKLTALTKPRLIDLKEEAEILGVDIVTDIADINPDDQPVFLEYQQLWFLDESQIAIAEKSRRTGLTWAEAGRNVMNAAKPRKRGGRNAFYVGSKQEMALEYIAAAALFAKAFNRLAQADVYEQTFWDSEKQEEILAYMIRFPKSGFKIQALSSRPSNLRGLQGDVVIDEAAFHESLEELLKAALALTMWGGRVRIISTHNGVDNLFNQYIQEAREGKKKYSIHRITLDDAIAQGLYKRICYVTGQTWSAEAEKEWRDDLYKNAPNKESADEEYGCVPKKSGGNYLSRILVEAAMVQDRSIPIFRFDAPDNFMELTNEQRQALADQFCTEHLLPALAKADPEHRHAFGEDFARNGDLTVFTPLAVRPDLSKRELFRVELRNTTYEIQKYIMIFIIRRLPCFAGGAFDATGNGGYLAEAAALEFGTAMIDCVKLSPAWYGEWMPKLKAEFDAFNIEVARHQSTLDDLMHIKVENGIPQIDKGRTKDLQSGGKAKRHGDFAVSLMMAVRATWMEGGEIADFIPATVEIQAPAGVSELDMRGPQYDHLEDLTHDYHEFEQGCW